MKTLEARDEEAVRHHAWDEEAVRRGMKTLEARDEKAVRPRDEEGL
jgi:hypothetical protein